MRVLGRLRASPADDERVSGELTTPEHQQSTARESSG